MFSSFFSSKRKDAQKGGVMLVVKTLYAFLTTFSLKAFSTLKLQSEAAGKLFPCPSKFQNKIINIRKM